MAYFRCGGGGIPSSLKTDMNNVLNKKFGTQSENYPPEEWPDDVNLMGLLPIRTASGTIAHFEDGAEDVPMKSVVANIVPIQSGSGTPSPSNPRPISGTSVLNVEKRGVNLFDEDLEEGWLNQTTGEPQEYSNRMRSKNFCSIVSNQTYYIKCGNNEEAYWYFYDSNKTYLRRRLIRNNTTTTQADECFFKVGIVGISSYSDDISLNYPSTDTSYHAYTGSTYPIALGQTVYGGSADVVGGTGSATWERKKIRELGTFSRYSNFFNVNITNTGFDSSADYLCEVFNNVGLKYDTAMAQQPEFSLGYSGNSLKFRYDSTTDPTQFLNDVGDYYIVHKIATPTEYTFTGQPINSYLGVNNMYLDSGEVLDVEYRADMNLLIAELET